MYIYGAYVNIHDIISLDIDLPSTNYNMEYKNMYIGTIAIVYSNMYIV